MLGGGVLHGLQLEVAGVAATVVVAGEGGLRLRVAWSFQASTRLSLQPPLLGNLGLHPPQPTSDDGIRDFLFGGGSPFSWP